MPHHPLRVEAPPGSPERNRWRVAQTSTVLLRVRFTARAVPPSGHPAGSPRRMPDALRLHPTTARAIALMEADLAARWTLAELAAQVHLSPSQLNRVFRADTGTTALGHLGALRAERMAELLRRTPMPACAAGEAVGWLDPGNASRRFHRHWGVSPSEYRAREAHG